MILMITISDIFAEVYYNRLNLSNLGISKYFNEDDYDSYAKAWWNLNTLGEDPDGEPVIRC